MVYKVVITGKAYLDIQNILAWYDNHSFDTANRFLDEVNNCIKKITASPSLYKKIGPEIQRCLLKIFPYIIYFSNQQEEIVILRVRHKKQKMLKRLK